MDCRDFYRFHRYISLSLFSQPCAACSGLLKFIVKYRLRVPNTRIVSHICITSIPCLFAKSREKQQQQQSKASHSLIMRTRIQSASLQEANSRGATRFPFRIINAARFARLLLLATMPLKCTRRKSDMRTLLYYPPPFNLFLAPHTREYVCSTRIYRELAALEPTPPGLLFLSSLRFSCTLFKGGF